MRHLPGVEGSAGGDAAASAPAPAGDRALRAHSSDARGRRRVDAHRRRSVGDQQRARRCTRRSCARARSSTSAARRTSDRRTSRVARRSTRRASTIRDRGARDAAARRRGTTSSAAATRSSPTGGCSLRAERRSWGGVAHPNHGENFEGPAARPPSSSRRRRRARVPGRPSSGCVPSAARRAAAAPGIPRSPALPDGKILPHGQGLPSSRTRATTTACSRSSIPTPGRWTDQGAAADIPASDAATTSPSTRASTCSPDGPRLLPDADRGADRAAPAGRAGSGIPASRAWTPVGSGPGGGFDGFDTSSVLLPLHAAEHYRARVLYTNRPDPKIIDLSALGARPGRTTSPRALSDPVTGPPVRYHATAVDPRRRHGAPRMGGHSDPNNWDPPVLTAELFDPDDRTPGRSLAAAAVPRVYHSVALLLPDGRVWTAGSDYGNGSHEMRMEIYSPPYLFAGPRPVDHRGARRRHGRPSTSTSTTPDAAAVATVALVRCGTATHALRSIDQRWVDLTIAQVQPGHLTRRRRPPNPRFAPPGYYMLFLLDANGVPSVAKILRLQSSVRPTISRLQPRSGPATGGDRRHDPRHELPSPAPSVSFGGAAATAVAVVERDRRSPPRRRRCRPEALNDVVVTKSRSLDPHPGGRLARRLSRRAGGAPLPRRRRDGSSAAESRRAAAAAISVRTTP